MDTTNELFNKYPFDDTDLKYNLYDAHCHPTEIPESHHAIPSMKIKKLIAMSTSLDDLDLVDDIAKKYPEKVIPAFGYHPWFSYKIYDDLSNKMDSAPEKYSHYSTILTPKPAPEESLLEYLPNPIPLSTVLEKIEQKLINHPKSLLGECGLDKSFCIPYPKNQSDDKRRLSPFRVQMAHQVQILKHLLALAAKHQRAASIHGVQCHGLLHQTIIKEPLTLNKTGNLWPPKICLHSYSGNPEFLVNNWFARPKKSKKKQEVENLPEIFVSCSLYVNEKSLPNLLKVIPKTSLLLESDYHEAGEVMDKLNNIVLRLSSEYLGEDPIELASQIEQNLERFLAT